MIRAISHRAPSQARLAIVIAAFAAIATVTPTSTASAQFGGLVKKARDKVVEQQVEKQVEKHTGSPSSSRADAPPTFDEVTLELTADRVDAVIRGLTAGRAVLDGTRGGPSRATLIASRDEAANKSANLSTQNAKLLNTYTNNRDEDQRCRNKARDVSREKRQAETEKRNQEYQAKAMSDPAFREKAMAIGQKMAVAQQRGDTAEIRRLGAELGLKVDDGEKIDSIAAVKACGPVPDKPAVLVQIEQLDKQANDLTEQIRQLEEKSAATEVKESRLTERQFLMARERVEAYLSAMKYKSKPGAFSPAEIEALNARRADLEKVM